MNANFSSNVSVFCVFAEGKKSLFEVVRDVIYWRFLVPFYSSAKQIARLFSAHDASFL